MNRSHLPMAVVPLLLLSAVVSRAGEDGAEWGADFKGLRMSIRSDRTRYRPDEPIAIEVAIRNTTRDAISLGMAAEDHASFDARVTPASNGPGRVDRMPMTRFGARRVAPAAGGKLLKLVLKAGEETRQRFPLGRMYDMSMEGEYSVVVDRAIPGRFRYDSDGHLLKDEAGKPPELTSNEIKLVISEVSPRK